MKLLMFGISSYPGGVETYIRNIFLNDLFSEKARITFVCYGDKVAYSEEIEKYGHSVIFVPNVRTNPIGYRKALISIFKSDSYDAVYVNTLNAANPLPVTLARKFGIEKIIVHSHCNALLAKGVKYILHKINRRSMDKNATVRLACGKKAASWMFDTDSHNVKIIPNAINTERYNFSQDNRRLVRDKYSISDETLVLGSVGRFGPEKNNIFMLEVLKNLVECGKDARLILVGDGAMRGEIEKFAEDNKLEDRVILAGTITDPYYMYSAFDVFLFPSSFEGFGIAALEAQSCGIKCLCSDTLERKLDVTDTVDFLSISESAQVWSDRIISGIAPMDRDAMNNAVKNSKFNIEHQIQCVMELI